MLALASGCKRATLVQHQYMYVSALETSLRDRVATMYNKIGTVHNGDRVEVLEKQRRFLRVRTDAGRKAGSRNAAWFRRRFTTPSRSS